MNAYLLPLIMSVVVCSLQALDKIIYEFSYDPIDIVIIAHKKDCATLNLAINGIGQNIEHRSIIVVSDQQLTDKALWFDEAQFPFTKHDVAFEIFQDEQRAQEFLDHPKSRIGWIYQQLCKLYALFVIPDISSNVLVIDADTIFLRPVTFQQEDGAPLFNVGTEYHKPYFAHMHRLIPELKKVYEDKSGVTHHMLFQKSVMEDFFSTIRAIHNEEPWKALCHCIDHEQMYGSSLSEYELYFNFICTRTDQAKLRPLQWLNMPLRNFAFEHSNYDYVSCHAYLS